MADSFTPEEREVLSVTEKTVRVSGEVTGGVVSRQSRIAYSDRTREEVTFVVQCGNGHLVGAQQQLVAPCSVCGTWLCSARGCLFHCSYCSRPFCRQHVRIARSEDKIRVFCSRHLFSFVKELLLGEWSWL